MNALKACLLKELPAINSYIQEQVEKLQPLVRPVARHAFLGGGKRLRPLLTLLVARGVGVNPDLDLYPLACSLEFLHTATLLHDDILDGASLRRGLPAAHTEHGVTETILAGDILLALANKLAAGYGRAELTSVLAEAIIRTASGEIDELSRFRDPKLTRQEYIDIVMGKTAYLLQASCQCGAIVAGASKELEGQISRFGLNLGVAFQLVDDALDYSSVAEVSGKPRGGDLREGKYTLPLILYLESLPARERDALRQALAEGDVPQERAEAVVAAVVEGGFDRQTRDAAAAYLKDAESALSSFPETQEKSLLRAMLDYVQQRDR